MESISELFAPYRVPISVERYHRMIDLGILTEDDKVELIEGVIVAVSPHSPEHAFALSSLSEILVRALGKEWKVRTQLPLTLVGSEPEPDLAVVSRSAERSCVRHPTTAALVVEVAKTSLSADRALASMYAAAGVDEYWVVDANREKVEVYRELRDGAYRDIFTAGVGDTIAPTQLQVSVPVADLFRSGPH